VPYRIDISSPPHDALDRLVQLSALDVDIDPDGGGIAAIIPDHVIPDALAGALGVPGVTVSPAVGRDNGSVWLVRSGTVRIGGLVIAPPDVAAPIGALRLTDSAAFGTGHHPTTALCIEALEEALANEMPDSVLDVGTGSGILALAALKMGAPRAVALDIDPDALRIAAENAHLNNMTARLQLVLGGPDTVNDVYPLIVANVLAAPLIEMASVLVRRVGCGGRLILSGIPLALEPEVGQAYQRLGLRQIRSETRAGWAVLVAQTSW
jgi:ribosomal protein L11 methylase PrmA